MNSAVKPHYLDAEFISLTQQRRPISMQVSLIPISRILNCELYCSFADDKSNRTPIGTKLVMLLCRVLLGKYTEVQEPCPRRTEAPKGFHSLIGTGKGVDDSLLFPEYVVYDKAQIYPEYIIHYVRE